MTVAPRHTVPQVDSAWPGCEDVPSVLATAIIDVEKFMQRLQQKAGNAA